jgi:hypothetical protein
MAKAVSITLEEMDDFLCDAQGFERLEPAEVGHPCGEFVYQHPTNERYAPGCHIRIYSSISRTGESRDVGADAIRCVLVDRSGYPWMKAMKRVHRVKGWRANILDRYERILDEPWNYKWAEEFPCPKCDEGILRCRWGRKGSFMGCSNYNPNQEDSCRHTEPAFIAEEIA